MSAPVNPAIAALAAGKSGGSYLYLNKLGYYLFEIQCAKINGMKAIGEFKVLKADKTSAIEDPHRVGEVVSYVEDLSNPKNGGASRFKTVCLSATGQTAADISTATVESVDESGAKVLERFSGEGAQAIWLAKVLDSAKQPLAHLLVACEIFMKPRKAVTKADGTVLPARDFRSERWTAVEMTDEQFAAASAARAKAKLPTFAEALK